MASNGNILPDSSWNNTGYHARQQSHASQGYASPSASSTAPGSYSQQQQQQHQHQQSAFQGMSQPVLQKRPSTSHMQGVVYHGSGNGNVPSQPGSPGYPSSHPTMMSPIPPNSSSSSSSLNAAGQQQHAQHGSHTGGMALSPGMRSNPQAGTGGSSFAYDQSRMSFSPVMPSGQQQLQQQQQYYSAPSTSNSSNNQRNMGLGVGGVHQSPQYSGSAAGPSSPFESMDQRQQQQQQRPTNLSNSNASAQYSNPQRQFNRSNSSASGALSISTSPTTAGQASPMTPSSPAALSSSTARGAASHQQQQQSHFQHQPQQQQHHNQQQQYSYQSGNNAASSSLNSMSPLDQQLRRPSLQQTPSSLSTYTNPSQTPDQAQAQAQAQYATYLEDPMSGFDRRIGSYSPSRYAVGVGGGSTSMQGGQFAPSSYQQQQHQASASLPSPRHAQSSPYFSPTTSTNPIPLPQAFQQQHPHQQRQSVSLSPSYSRQGQQQLASTSMTHAPSSSTSSNAYSPAPQQGSSSTMKPYHSRSGSYPSPQTNSHALARQRPRSTGSAFRQVRTASDLKPSQKTEQGNRRADPDGGVVSPLKALTTQLSQTYHLVDPNFRYEFSLNPRRVLTKPSKPCGNNGYDNEDCDYILYVNDVLGSEGNKYLILDVLGQGTFGQVVKCQNLKTHEIVGVKVIKNKEAYAQQSTMEIMILDILNGTYDPEDKHHILRLKDSFTHQKHLCLVFELLSSNLYELIKQNSFRGLSLSLVRVFTEQLLDALCVLKDAKLIHCDLKPENILLKTLQSPDIKVIDFGSACHEKQTVYTYIQSRFYRSPEVLLGLPYSTSIDMWSLGCICVELFLGLPLFPGTSEFNQITRIVEMLGLPPTYMLESGKQVHNFFNFYYDNYGQKRWQLKSLEEYCREHPNAKEQPSKKFFSATTLPEIVKQYPNQRKNLTPTDLERESQNRLSFIDFVSGLLNMNPLERWTPQQAKLHPFVQNKEFTGPFAPPLGPGQAYGSAAASRTKDLAQDRPYGGLPPTPARTSTQTYQDAASYQQHLNAQQAHNAMASANAYRQAQYVSNNPYALPASNMPEQQASRQQQQQASASYQVPKLPPISITAPTNSQHSPSHSMNVPSSATRMSSGNPLSPNIPMNPPQAHHYPVRARSGTFSQMDVPPALQRLGIDLSSFKAIGTPQLHRDEQRAAWERRNSGNNELDRRRSLKQSNPHLEHLEHYAQNHPAYYYAPGSMQQQPFSVVVDPRMGDPAQQRHHHQAAASVTVPPPAYGGQPGMRYIQQQSQQLLQGNMPPPGSSGAYNEPFDQFDSRDGLNSMMHQPLLPNQAGPHQYYPQNQNQGQMYNMPYGTSSGGMDMTNPPVTGKQKRSDQQIWP